MPRAGIFSTFDQRPSRENSPAGREHAVILAGQPFLHPLRLGAVDVAARSFEVAFAPQCPPQESHSDPALLFLIVIFLALVLR